MRGLLCRSCGLRAQGSPAPHNMTRITPANEDGPAEFERFIWGTARHPKRSQRVRTIIEGPNPPQHVALPPDAYDCDTCGAPILPGAEACCHSASDAGRRIAPWETEFIDTIEVPA